jgi:hypothetical protein
MVWFRRVLKGLYHAGSSSGSERNNETHLPFVLFTLCDKISHPVGIFVPFVFDALHSCGFRELQRLFPISRQQGLLLRID